MIDNNQYSRYSAAFILFAIGDALGWPNENRSNNINEKKEYDFFESWKRYAGGKYWRHQEIIGKGEYSDDTQLMISTARSLIYQKDWKTNFYSIELPFWLKYERGGGRATKSAAKNIKQGKFPWLTENKDLEDYFNAGGNGVAMRILPYVVTEHNDIKKLIGNVIINGIYTHGNPRALLGATCYAYALYLLSQKQDMLKYGELIENLIKDKHVWTTFPQINGIEEWKEIFEKVNKREFLKVWNENVDLVYKELEHVRKCLDKGMLDVTKVTLEQLGVFEKKVGGAGDITAITAIYLASKYATNPRKAILEAANLSGADTDTIAAMTGALLGILFGEDIIPIEWTNVQDYEFLKKMPRYLLEPEMYWKEEEKNNQQYINSPIGKIIKIYDKKVNIGQTRRAITTKYESVHGQTIYIKEYLDFKYRKNEEKENLKVFQKEIFQMPELNQMEIKEFVSFLYDSILTNMTKDDLMNRYKLSDEIISKIEKYK